MKKRIKKPIFKFLKSWKKRNNLNFLNKEDFYIYDIENNIIGKEEKIIDSNDY